MGKNIFLETAMYLFLNRSSDAGLLEVLILPEQRMNFLLLPSVRPLILASQLLTLLTFMEMDILKIWLAEQSPDMIVLISLLFPNYGKPGWLKIRWKLPVMPV